MSSPVKLWREPVIFPTYEPFPANKNPMFLEKRVYQGSSGKVYPLPVTDRIAEQKTERAWDAVHLENEFLRIVVLPEIGGRIHVAQDKTNGYDLIYRQEVIKPALVGLAGPWLSGGIEFNWPQHHRPSTYMPVDVHLEEHADGSKTVWLSEHDPMLRMKGMHGVCLHPGRAVIELKARAYNRTPFVQTFLWWANVATRVHEAYQSFFPPDVYYVADHAKRSMSAYPLAEGHYYGVDYGARGRHGVPANEVPCQYIPPHCTAQKAGRSKPKTQNSKPAAPTYAPNDLSWYANIPVPTSYMCMGSKEDFFGGYDYHRQAGIVHVANRHISPGKKQWTWGNHEFGYAWDRNLTDADAAGEHPPYIEIMSGVYTDNQPDFSFLQPGETKTWSQYWYPIREIGAAQHATLEAALSLNVTGRTARIGVAVTRPQAGAKLLIENVSAKRRGVWQRKTLQLAPDRPWQGEVTLRAGVAATDLRISLHSADGAVLLSYQPRPRPKADVPAAATEPLAPEMIASADELYVTGLHLEQYRHATRKPAPYWREALRRDPGDARCNQALGAWHLRRGELDAAERHLRAAIERLTSRNPNPYNGEPYYTLGLCLRYRAMWAAVGLGEDGRSAESLLTDAYAAFYKATWNQAWQAPAYHALAEIDCSRGEWAKALEHLDRALRVNTDNLRARDLKVVVLRRLGLQREAEALLRATLELDPLDWWARDLNGETLACATQTRLDLAHDYARAGLHADALRLLEKADPRPESGTAPLVAYTAAWLCRVSGSETAARRWLGRARKASPDYCFPSRLEEIAILSWAMGGDGKDARAPYYLGNLLYDRERHAEAITCWERAARLEPGNAIVWRNLGIGYFNVQQDAAKARRAYDRALRANPADARLLYERDQLWKRLGVPAQERLAALEANPELVRQRDDLSVELGALLLQVGRAAEALAGVIARRFQPWEGGEGLSRDVFVRSHLALGRSALGRRDARVAREHFEAALTTPENLGEARHLLVNPGEVYYWLGCACDALGDRTGAREAWQRAAASAGDFQEMSVTAYSEKTYYVARAWERLGRRGAARTLLRHLLAYARRLRGERATIDYFATSLPTMILFDDDLQARRATHALFLEALAQLGLGERTAARRMLREVLRRDPSHAGAREHLE